MSKYPKYLKDAQNIGTFRFVPKGMISENDIFDFLALDPQESSDSLTTQSIEGFEKIVVTAYLNKNLVVRHFFENLLDGVEHFFCQGEILVWAYNQKWPIPQRHSHLIEPLIMNSVPKQIPKNLKVSINDPHMEAYWADFVEKIGPNHRKILTRMAVTRLHLDSYKGKAVPSQKVIHLEMKKKSMIEGCGLQQGDHFMAHTLKPVKDASVIG